jgi:ABC transport system ATP-binding/permease protein
MPIVTLRNVTIGYRGPPLLDGVSCLIEPGAKIGLLGRNGAGKTTLLRMLSGETEPDHGEVTLAPGARTAILPQEVPNDLTGSVRQVVAAGVAGGVLSHDDEHRHAWRAENQVDQILSRMELTADAEFSRLSAGMKRRVLLARALASQPDLLLLDEPTNHLDIEAITWLEEFLKRADVTLIFVTHDRMFLRKLADRILEIDRGRLFDWSCDYDTFLVRKQTELAAEEKQNALFDKKLAEEEVWIRKGVEARRTRNMGRVRALEAMRQTRSKRRDATSQAKIVVQNARRSGVLVAEVDDISFAYEGRPIVEHFSTEIIRGDKIGIIGPNGAGKTTILRLLLGQLEPQSGKVRLGTNLDIAYFDQLRRVLDEELSVQENVGDGSDAVFIDGEARHVIGYLQDFLFSAERARTKVKFLSGGERVRVLLAKLFAKPANIIVLDEPTNDLDAETLELLEERLAQFTGTVLAVSHDRQFLNNVVTSTIVFEPKQADEKGPTQDGVPQYVVNEYVGGYDDWLRQRPEPTKPAKPQLASPKPDDKTPVAEKPDARKRLTYKENQELETLTRRIDELEKTIAGLHADMAEAEFYQQSKEAIARAQSQLKSGDEELATALARWEELAARAG